MKNLVQHVALHFTLFFTCLAVQAEVQFNEDIRPILSDKCFHCHGPDSGTREANLRLDTAEGLLTDLGGYFSIVPGSPEESEVYKRITHAVLEERMPPPKAHKVVTEQEQKLIYQWIKEGANWQGHWAFEAISEPAPPKVKNKQWSNNTIDQFVLSKLEDSKLTPSHRAKPETLVRRLYLDLTGLPPTFKDVQAFLNDDSENAYEKVVDKLLATRSFGEHQASFWLDAARYADTHGLHLDNYRSIWPYRDWVVNAFNKNMPFDQFTIEQLAGDMLPSPTQEQLIATGFTRSSPTTSEGGAIDEEYYAVYAKDRTETMSTVWMGLTTGCAGCHDHKFDPISQKEFYQLTAFFRNTTEKAMDGNVLDTPPSIPIFTKKESFTIQNIIKRQDDIKSRFGALTQENYDSIQDWLDDLQPLKGALPVASSRLAFRLPANEGKGTDIKGYGKHDEFSAKVDGKYKWVDGKQGKALGINQSTLITLDETAAYTYDDSFSVSFWLKTPKGEVKGQPIIGRIDVDKGWWDWESKTAGWFVEVINNKSIRLAMNYPGSLFIQSQILDALTPETWHQVTIKYDGNAKRDSFRFYVDGKYLASNDTQTLQNRKRYADSKKTKLKNALAVGFIKNPYAHEKTRDDTFEKHAKSEFVSIQDVRVYDGLLSDTEITLLSRLPEINNLLAPDQNQWLPEQKQLLSQYYSTQFMDSGIALGEQHSELLSTLAAIRKTAPSTLIMQEKSNGTPFAHILERGQYDQKGEKVNANVPATLPPMTAGEFPNRLDLARWLVSDEHPLTARVTVNRFWQSLFGKGLVETAEDFGSQGTPPSHPLLLDWLASDFKNNGWDVKRTIKQMVMSQTYQQSSDVSEEIAQRDPSNVLLARAHRARLNAEVIRDQALYVSGLLVDKVGGPPVKPYQPPGLWRAVAYVDSNTAKFEQDHGESLYRKSLYTYRKRTASPPGMALFDAPDRESCTVRREQTNTPLQALLLMNDPQFVEAARHMAEKVMQSADTDTDKFDYLISQTLGRRSDKQAKAILKSTYDEILALYQADEASAHALLTVGDSQANESLETVELATWTILASQVFNLDEFITRN